MPKLKSGHCLTKSTISKVAPIPALLLAGRSAERYPRTSGAASPWSRGANDTARDLVLQFENVVEGAIEAVRPNVGAGRRIDQLTGDAHALPRIAHAPFQHVAHAQFPRHLPYTDRPALEGEARIARDHEQPGQTRDRGRDLFDHTVREIFLIGVAAQVLKRQYRQRRLMGRGKAVAGPPAVGANRTR